MQSSIKVFDIGTIGFTENHQEASKKFEASCVKINLWFFKHDE